jgi:hypothetical protein
MFIRCLVFICMTIVLATPTRVQQPHDDAILFIWNDVLMAQSIQGNAFVQTTITSAEAWPTLPTDGINLYTFEQAPLTEPPADDYGFYQGLWSPDHTQFVFLAIEPDGPHYRVISVENEQQQILLFGQLDLNEVILCLLVGRTMAC